MALALMPLLLLSGACGDEQQGGQVVHRDAGTGGGTGTGGNGGAGSGGTAGDSGRGGTSGDVGATGGISGVGGSAPCSGACSGATPVCNETTNECVECTSQTHCSGNTPLCNTSPNTCVECLLSTSCTNANASRCQAGECSPCMTSSDCGHIAGKGVCDAGECVECTGKDYSACGLDGMSRQRVCDTLNRTCSTQTERSQGLCQSCVSDAACNAGQACVLQRFGDPAQDVGYFCFWKEGDTANGAPADCPTSGRLYVRTISNAESIDGTTTDICGLRVSTCIARNEFSSKDCTSGAAGNDGLCGFDAPDDARCVPFGAGFLCTMRCGSNLDCPPPNFTCNTAVAQPYCEL